MRKSAALAARNNAAQCIPGDTRGRRGILALLVPFVLAIGLFAPRALAQADTQKMRELELKLEQSLKTISDLAARVKELEARSEAQTSGTQSPQSPSTEQSEPLGTAAPDSGSSGAGFVKEPLVIRGFADVGWGSAGGGGVQKGFRDSAMSFYLTPRFSESIKSLVELVFERSKDGSLSTDLERLQIGYTFSNNATLWLGRFHTPLGYWNTAFHHGQQLQTAVLRPQMIDFEDHGGVLPVHTLGVWGTGSFTAGSGKISYDLYGGNAPTIIGGVLTPNDLGKTTPGSSFGLNLGYLFSGQLDGLRVGAHGYRADVRDDTPALARTRLGIFGGYAALDSTLWEIIAEYYGFRNDDVSGGTGQHRSWTGFGQIGRRFDRWTPYARYERASLDQQDNYFAAQLSGRSYKRGAIGLRYDLTPDSALKGEFTRTEREDSPTVRFSQFLMQWAIRF